MRADARAPRRGAQGRRCRRAPVGQVRRRPPRRSAPTIERVGRRGKYLLVELDDGRDLVIHLGMTGRLRLRSRRARRRSLRAGVVGARRRRGPRAARRPSVRSGRRRAAGAVTTLCRPSPPSGPSRSPRRSRPRCSGRRLRRSRLRVKTQLLQQRAVAGVGNIYADEALWRAGVDPAARKVTRPQAARLHAAIREVLAAGSTNGGTTLRDYRTVDGGTGSNQHHLDCYGRAGEPCNRCAATFVARCSTAGAPPGARSASVADRVADDAPVPLGPAGPAGTVAAHVRPVLHQRQDRPRDRRQPGHRPDDRPRLRRGRRQRLHLVPQGRRVRGGGRRARRARHVPGPARRPLDRGRVPARSPTRSPSERTRSTSS